MPVSADSALFWPSDLRALWLTEFAGVLQERRRPKSPFQLMDVRRRRILLTVLVVVLAVVLASMAAGALASFPTSLLLPLLLMAAATALFYIWA